MRTPLLLYVLALAVRGLLIVQFPDPGYPDASYYVDAARAIHAGQGLNVDFVWIFAEVGGAIPAHAVLPIPAFGHWMPLASLVQVPFLLAFGDVAWASALPFALIGALAAPLTWAIARSLGARPLVSIGAGLLVAVPVLTTAFMAQPDNFSLYQPLVTAALWMAARGLRGSKGSFVAAGLLAGLATLARTDGILVLIAIGFVFAWDRTRVRRAPAVVAGGALIAEPSSGPRIPTWAAVASLVAFLLVMAPWWVRQLMTFGTLSPSTASGKVLFIRDIAEWNSIATPADLGHLLGMGLAPLIESRIGGFIAAAWIYIVLVCGVVFAPPLAIGAWARRHAEPLLPFFAYAALLFAFSGLVSAVHVPGGTFIHSAVALAPYSYILVLEGIVIAVRWVAQRRPAWNVALSTRVFCSTAIVMAMLLAWVGAGSVHGAWNVTRSRALIVADSLSTARVPLTDRVMSIDAAGTRYATGYGGVVLVNDPLGTILDVANAYDIRWIVLDAGAEVSAATPVLNGERPAWIGPPIYLEPGTFGIYPVCLQSEVDPRCFGTP